MKKSRLIAMGILTASCMLTEPFAAFAAETDPETECISGDTSYGTEESSEASEEEVLAEEKQEEESAGKMEQDDDNSLSEAVFVSMFLPYEDAFILYGEEIDLSEEAVPCEVMLSQGDLHSLRQAAAGELYSYEILEEEPATYLTAALKDGTLIFYADSLTETETADFFSAANTETAEPSEEEIGTSEALEAEDQDSSSDSGEETNDSSASSSSSRKKKSSSTKSSSGKSSSSKSSSKKSSGSATEDGTSSEKNSSKKEKAAEDTENKEQQIGEKEKTEHKSSSEKAESDTSDSKGKHKKKTKQADSGNVTGKSTEQETDIGVYTAACVLGFLSAALVLYLKIKK